MFDWSGEAGLTALFAAAFVSATLVPASSEVVLVAVLKAHPDRAMAAIALATIGNTLGGMTMYALGRLVPERHVPAERVGAFVRRHGRWALLLAWAPVVGDALCAAAGWLRVPPVGAALAMAAGKLARYLVVAYVAAAL